MTIKTMANVGIVVENLDATIEFFTKLGLTLEGRATVEGDWRRSARPPSPRGSAPGRPRLSDAF